MCVLQLEYVGWQLNLQMAQSSQARLKSPSAVLQLGLRNEDSEVRTDTVYMTIIISSSSLIHTNYQKTLIIHRYRRLSK